MSVAWALMELLFVGIGYFCMMAGYRTLLGVFIVIWFIIGFLGLRVRESPLYLLGKRNWMKFHEVITATAEENHKSLDAKFVEYARYEKKMQAHTLNRDGSFVVDNYDDTTTDTESII
jgi:hypothetical protein